MRRRVVLLPAVALVAGGGVVLSAGLSARTAASDLERARAALATLSADDVDSPQAVPVLRRAQADLDRARQELSGWPVDVVAAVPVLGRSWDVERAVAGTGSGVVDGALAVVDLLPSLRARGGGLDPAALGRVHDALSGPSSRAGAALDDLHATPTGLTPRQVRRGAAAADEVLGPAVATLDRATTGLGVAEGLLGGSGPRSLLIALQNNAELRGAGGYVSTFGTGRLDRGRLALEPLQDLVAVADPPERARRVPAPAEYAEDYGPLSGDTTLWRSWNMSPHVPHTALVGARVAGELLGTEPDVVVLLDVPAMAALASLGGEDLVLPDGSTVGPDDLTDALLVDAYQAAGARGADQVKRRSQLRQAATQAVGRLLSGDVPATELLRTVGRLAAGRHLSVWSSRPQEQATLVDLGVAGAVQAPRGGDLSHVSVNNLGGNKLDVYVDRRVGHEVTLTADEASVVQRVRLANEAPAGLVPYVAGRDRPGTVTSRVELSLPTGASRVLATVDGRPWPAQERLRRGADRLRLVTRVVLPRGAATLLEVRYALPVQDGTYRLRLLPQPLAQDARLTLSVRTSQGRLQALDGVELREGAVAERDVAFDRSRELEVRVDRTLWERLQDFWSSPVETG